MRILLTTIFNYPHTGGLSTHMQTLAKGLEELGEEVDILSMADFSLSLVTMLASGPAFAVNKVAKGWGFVWSQELRQRFLARMLKEKLAHKKYDVINTQDIYAFQAVYPLAKEYGIPLVQTVHGYFTYEAASRGTLEMDSAPAQYLLQKERDTYNKAKRVVTVDTRLKNYVLPHLNDPEVVVMIKNFLDSEEFTPRPKEKATLRQKWKLPEDKIIFLCPRRLVKKNGVTYPALALAQLLGKESGIKPHSQAENLLLLYAGEGPEVKNIEEVINSKGLQEQVKMLGAVGHKEMQNLYNLADLVIIPSVHVEGVEEATSISALEGMATGGTVIASRIGGLAELIEDEYNGLLVPDKDVNKLAQAMARLIDDPELREKLAKQARAQIEADHSHISAARKYLEIYANTPL